MTTPGSRAESDEETLAPGGPSRGALHDRAADPAAFSIRSTPGIQHGGALIVTLPLRLLERLAIYVVPSFLLYTVVMWGLWHVPNDAWGMYGNIDGAWLAWNQRAILRWGRALDLSPFNPVSGMGSIFAPYLPWLNPGAWALGLPLPRDLTYVVSYTIYFWELVAANLLLFRVLGLSPVASIIAAQVYLLVLFPPTNGVVGSLYWYSLAPVNAHLVAMANVSLVMFLLTGRLGRGGNIACLGGMLASILSGLFSGAILFLTYGPIYVLAALTLLMGAPAGERSLRWKIASVVAVAGMLILLGFPDYLLATVRTSARSGGASAPLESLRSLADLQRVWSVFSACSRANELLCPRFLVFWFHLGALVGAVLQVLRGPSRLRLLAAGFFAYVGLVHLYEIGIQGHVLKPPVISAPYLVWSAYVFYAFFFVAGIGLLLPSRFPWLRRLRSRRPAALGAGARRAARAGLACVLVPGLAAYWWTKDIAPYQPPPPRHKSLLGVLGPGPAREPVVGPITRYLIEHASLRPGGYFHGYTVTYFGDPAGHIRQAVGYDTPNRSWDVYVRARHYLEKHYGNRFQETDLWDFDIPTFEEYGQWVSRQAQAFATELFSAPGDAGHPVFLRVYRLDLDLLPPLGVRFVISDVRLHQPEAALRAQETSATAGPIYLYELRAPNLGDYRPTRASPVGTFAEAVGAVRDRKGALKSDVIVFTDLPGPFASARNVKFRIQRDGFRLAAESDGRSLLLLPVQFSRCLRPRAARPWVDLSTIRLLRGNAVQTLLLFEKRVDVRVRFKFGLLGEARCRQRDARDLAALGLRG